jgi:hypothetical protein
MKEITTIVDLTGRFGGHCPVQGYGEIDGKHWYFRARGAYWSFEVYADLNRETVYWEYGEDYGSEYEASYMPEEDVLKCLEKSVNMYLVAKVKNK